jgi:hypothetical protein
LLDWIFPRPVTMISRGPSPEQCREFSTFLCPHCDPPRRLDGFTAENDYMCDVHGFVNPVRPDGAVIVGDGQCGRPRVMGGQ